MIIGIMDSINFLVIPSSNINCTACITKVLYCGFAPTSLPMRQQSKAKKDFPRVWDAIFLMVSIVPLAEKKT